MIYTIGMFNRRGRKRDDSRLGAWDRNRASATAAAAAGAVNFMRRSSRAALLMAVAAMLLSACQSYRIEHHRRPAFYEKAALGELPDELVLEDGTIVKYSTRVTQRRLHAQSNESAGKPFQMREERDDGMVILSAYLPEHVIVNTLTCLRNEEYELLWDQLVAERTKQAAAEAGEGVEEFAAWMRKHRHDLVATLTRMAAGIHNEAISVTPMGDNLIRCRLRPQIAQPFKFKTIDMAREGFDLKLVGIR